MLPIFRTVTVGGVLLAMILLALALSPTGRSQPQFSALDAPARGVMIDASAHPEWRQFIILAAFQRASELNRLRDLPDTPMRLPEIPFVAPDYVPPAFPPAVDKSETNGAARYAGLPAPHDDAGAASGLDDETGSINVAPHATIPIEIGERSSTELPVAPVEDKPPVATLPLTESPPAADSSATVVPMAAAPAAGAPLALALKVPMPPVKIAIGTPPKSPEPAGRPASPRKKIQRHHRARAARPASQAQPQAASINPLQRFFDNLGKPATTPDNVAAAKALDSKTSASKTSASKASTGKAPRKATAHLRRPKTKTAVASQAVSQ